jgi:alcohol dehydrogenase class IV
MTLEPFAIGRLPRVEFGAGRFSLVPDVVARHGTNVLVVTGARSFRDSQRWQWLSAELERRAVRSADLVVEGEPTPEAIDGAVGRFRDAGVEVVLAIGGGSVLDTAKAVAGLLRTGTSVMDHLEAVGRGVPYPGPSVPFVAVPTTAGTGSEATRNAVVSVAGEFKRSFRDERLVAADAVVDPDLLLGLGPADIAANGMDAVAQLLESYVSTGATPFTDALALAGLEAARDGLLAWYGAVRDGRPNADTHARAGMAWASLASGICLAHAGLGVIHGLAAPVGALFRIRHGVACGALLAAGVEVNLRALASRNPGSPVLDRFAAVGRLLGGVPADVAPEDARRRLVDTLRDWTTRLAVPGVGGLGVSGAELDRIVAASRAGSMRTNPITLSDDELMDVLGASL